MNSLTIICEHPSLNTVSNLKSIMAYAEKNKLSFIAPEQLPIFFDDKLGGNHILVTFDDGQEHKYPDIAPFLRTNKLKVLTFVIPLYYTFTALYTNFEYYLRNPDIYEVGAHTLTHTMVCKSPEDTRFPVPEFKLCYPQTKKSTEGQYLYGLIAKEYNSMNRRYETDTEYNRRIDIEIAFSKEWIERALGKECQWFAYPSGVFNDSVISKVIEAGYKYAFTVNRTLNTKFTIPRILSTELDFTNKSNIIGEVIIISKDKLSQNDIDVEHGIYK